jgi:hypothetical protein
VAKLGADIYDQLVFVGSMISQLCHAVFHLKSVRWKDVWIFIEKGGANAAPLIIMAGFLIGVIMAFQSALPLKQMGSDVFVANVVAFAVLRELGPLITAIILAGRTGSAIAAEIGTMKINEEINALTKMGLDLSVSLWSAGCWGYFFWHRFTISPIFWMFCEYRVQVVIIPRRLISIRSPLPSISAMSRHFLKRSVLDCHRRDRPPARLQTKRASAVGESTTTSSLLHGHDHHPDGVISAIYVLGI